jgi:histidine ammonia-lyase
MMGVTIDGGPLTRDQVVAVANRAATVSLSPAAVEAMEASRATVEHAIAEGRVVYGITTGFGALATTHISGAQVDLLQYELLRSHAAAVGDPLPDRVVRAMLLLRARTLAQGHSGVRPLIVRTILELLRHDILPVVPGQGSVGASGDLAQFAHLALPLIGEGLVRENGEIVAAIDALRRAGIEPVVLHAKEGLSLLNGTEGMLAMGVLALAEAERLADVADQACALTVEAVLGSARPYDPRIHRLRPHPGQAESARRIRALLHGSQIEASHHDDFTHAVQDAYSLRCAPQVHGAVRDTIEHAARVFERELGSVVDNPIVFPDTDEVISAGNFHGQPLAFALDFLAIALEELASISERRTDRMLDPTRSSGLSPFLASQAGLHSGLMLAQYTAAALVAETRVLAHPASIDSIPTSGLQEDHVSMGFGAARKLWTVIDNVRRVLAVELLCAAQGVDQRAPLRPGVGTSEVHRAVRSVVATLTDDRPIGVDIEAIARLIVTGHLDGVGVD